MKQDSKKLGEFPGKRNEGIEDKIIKQGRAINRLLIHCKVLSSLTKDLRGI